MAREKDIILSILIPTLESRSEYYMSLMAELNKQIDACKSDYTIETLTYSDNGEAKIGAKRNNLLLNANGKYVCFFDDDDFPSEHYISELIKGMEKGADCISLRGIMTTNGKNPEIFEHSIKYNSYKTTKNEIKYERYPNHLNCIKASIAKQFKFKESNWGEDTDWATQIFNSGLIKTEYYTEEILYHYRYISNK